MFNGCSLYLDNQIVPCVNSFKYLGIKYLVKNSLTFTSFSFIYMKTYVSFLLLICNYFNVYLRSDKY